MSTNVSGSSSARHLLSEERKAKLVGKLAEDSGAKD